METGNVQETQKNGKKRRKLWYSIFALIFCAGLTTAYWYFFLYGIVYSDDARIDGEMVDLAPQVSGTLTDVYVSEGDRVKKGQVIFALNQESFIADLAKAKATLSQLETTLQIAGTRHEKALHGTRIEEINIMKATKEKTEVQAKFAETNYLRTKTLFKKKLSSRENLEQAQSTWEIAQHTFEEANNRLQLLQAGTRKEDLVLAEENVRLAQRQKEIAEIAVEQAQIHLDLTLVKAPFDGVVVRRWQDPGGVATTGRSVVTLFNPNDIHVEANIEEKYLNQVRVGDEVDIAVDAYPDLSLTGRISIILPVANSQFSLIPSEGVSGTFIKVSQRLPIRIEINDLPDCPLGPGLSVEVHIHQNSSQPDSLAFK